MKESDKRGRGARMRGRFFSYFCGVFRFSFAFYCKGCSIRVSVKPQNHLFQDDSRLISATRVAGNGFLFFLLSTVGCCGI